MTTQLSEQTGYGFAIGRIRSLETMLLDRGAYAKFLRATDDQVFTNALKETHYGTFLDAIKDGPVVTGALNAAWTWNFGFLAQYAAAGWLLDIFRVAADAHNIKIHFKHRISGTQPRAAELLAFGRRSLEEIAHAAGSDGWTTLGVGTFPASHTTDPVTIDAAIDRWAQSEQVRLAAASDFLAGYYALHADIENLRSLIRTKALGEGRQELQETLLPGGGIAADILLGLLEAEWTALAGQIPDRRLRSPVDEGVAHMRQRHSLLRFERLGREAELSHLRGSKYAVFGYEPLVEFYLRNDNEIRNLRQLHAASVAGVPETDRQDLIALVD